jgi:hypothetical protein
VQQQGIAGWTPARRRSLRTLKLVLGGVSAPRGADAIEFEDGLDLFKRLVGSVG